MLFTANATQYENETEKPMLNTNQPAQKERSLISISKAEPKLASESAQNANKNEVFNRSNNGFTPDMKDSTQETNGKSTLEKLLEKVRVNAGEGKAEAFGAETVRKLTEVLQNQVFSGNLSLCNYNLKYIEIKWKH